MEIIDDKIAVKLKKSIRFRNIAVHSYGELDLESTFTIAQNI